MRLHHGNDGVAVVACRGHCKAVRGTYAVDVPCSNLKYPRWLRLLTSSRGREMSLHQTARAHR